ncbi:MAG: PHP domain-containing protein [Thermodesulfobacteriota bacterium]|nr:PHP domain-containing protein [Thermodesulfobacteriota bacterium]
MMGLKLDLHTHCYEATMYTSVKSVENIINTVKAKGLDGIAVTEHLDADYGYKVKQIVEKYFNSKVLIIPGQEINTELVHVQVVELYLSDRATFRFVVHPYHVSDFHRYVAANAHKLHGVEINNFQHKWEMNQINREEIQAIADKHELMLLTNSDAHSLDNIGRYYNEVDLQELFDRINRRQFKNE